MRRILTTGASPLPHSSTVVVNGEPFFPFGFFANVGDPIRDLTVIGQNGFNTTYCNNMCDDAYYAQAASLSIYVISDIWWPGPQSTVVSSRDKSPLIAYYVADDMNYDGSCQNPKYTPAAVAARSAQIRSYDRNPPHATTGGVVLAPSSGCIVSPYLGTVDFLQGYNYPIASWVTESQALEINAQALKSLVAAANGAWPVVAIAQAFSWPDWRLPTPVEALNMNYAALALGINGIMMYTVSDPNGYYLPTDGPDLWAEFVEETSEVIALIPMLLGGSRTTLTTQSRVYASSWQLGNQTLVIAVSTDRSGNRTVDFTLPTSATVTPKFARLAGTLQQNGNHLAGTMPPESVQVYSNY